MRLCGDQLNVWVFQTLSVLWLFFCFWFALKCVATKGWVEIFLPVKLQKGHVDEKISPEPLLTLTLRSKQVGFQFWGEPSLQGARSFISFWGAKAQQAACNFLFLFFAAKFCENVPKQTSWNTSFLVIYDQLTDWFNESALDQPQILIKLKLKSIQLQRQEISSR